MVCAVRPKLYKILLLGEDINLAGISQIITTIDKIAVAAAVQNSSIFNPKLLAGNSILIKF